MNFLSKLKFLPRWIIATLDSLILFYCALFGYLVRFNFELELIEEYDAFAGSFTFMVGGLLVMQNTRSYEGIVRHTGFRDGSNIFKTVVINFILNLCKRKLMTEKELQNYFTILIILWIQENI